MSFGKPFWYNGRDERAEFAAEVFCDYINNSVLDVGCWKRDLEDELPDDFNYTGIDIAGDPDIVVDLEREGLSQFDRNQFDTVVCLDVLEHLENIHEVFDDICRIASNYALISLPNNYMMRHLKRGLLTGKTVTGKFYGLPPKEPEDRHKWFFNYEQAKTFVIERGKTNNAPLVKTFDYPEDLSFTLIERFKRVIFRGITAPFYGKRGYNNMLVSTLWAVLDTSNS
jgi:hypothetical protein